LTVLIAAGIALSLYTGIDPKDGSVSATLIAAILWITSVLRPAFRHPALLPVAQVIALVFGASELVAFDPHLAMDWIGVLAPVGIAMGFSFVDREEADWARVGLGILGMLLVLIVPTVAGPEWASWVTAVWGASGLGLFACGWIRGSQPHRILALATIGLSIGRAFLVDLDNTFARIVAFLALGLALLLIGFLYSRVERKPKER